MERGDSVLNTLFRDKSVDDGQDVEMLDVEEGQFTEPISKTQAGQSSNVATDNINIEPNKTNSTHKKMKKNKKKKKKKNKHKRGSTSGTTNVTDINRFVLDACKRLRERKSYLMWTAVGCLGVSALSDLIKEVDVIQSCGGQKTADGKRFRNGGGILWNIIKVREPNAYQEIMRKGKEFEKQFKQQLHAKQEPKQQIGTTTQNITRKDGHVNHNLSDGVELTSHDQSQPELRNASQRRASVHDRIRQPVTYDDLLVGGDDPKDDLASLQ